MTYPCYICVMLSSSWSLFLIWFLVQFCVGVILTQVYRRLIFFLTNFDDAKDNSNKNIPFFSSSSLYKFRFFSIVDRSVSFEGYSLNDLKLHHTTDFCFTKGGGGDVRTVVARRRSKRLEGQRFADRKTK